MGLYVLKGDRKELQDLANERRLPGCVLWGTGRHDLSIGDDLYLGEDDSTTHPLYRHVCLYISRVYCVAVYFAVYFAVLWVERIQPFSAALQVPLIRLAASDFWRPRQSA